MVYRLGMVLLAQTFLACGGTTATNIGDSNSTGGTITTNGGASGSSNSAGAGAWIGNTGGMPSVGGSGGTGNCFGAVAFQVVPAPNSPTQWCLGTPGNCGGQTMTILDSTGELELSSFCQVNCDTCTVNICPPLACLLPVELTNTGSSFSWDGTYVTSSSCGASATVCLAKRCAARGKYQFKVCGFANPDPTTASACSSAPSTTTPTCTQVSFDYPTSAPVVATMPLMP